MTDDQWSADNHERTVFGHHVAVGNPSPPTKAPVAASTILEEAISTVESRMQQYGPPTRNHQTIADLWCAYLSARFGEGVGTLLTPRDVNMMMVLVKVARDAFTAKRDNLVDIAGYARCAEIITPVEWGAKANVPASNMPRHAETTTNNPVEQQRTPFVPPIAPADLCRDSVDLEVVEHRLPPRQPAKIDVAAVLAEVEQEQALRKKLQQWGDALDEQQKTNDVNKIRDSHGNTGFVVAKDGKK